MKYQKIEITTSVPFADPIWIDKYGRLRILNILTRNNYAVLPINTEVTIATLTDSSLIPSKDISVSFTVLDLHMNDYGAGRAGIRTDGEIWINTGQNQGWGYNVVIPYFV